MKDYLVKAVSEDKMFRAYAVNAKEMVSVAQKDHDTWSASSAALGRTLIATTMLATSIDKSGAAITVKISGGGPAGQIVADADFQGNVKGFISKPHIHLPLNAKGHIDVGGAVGHNGVLEVTRASKGEDPYTSDVPLATGEIGDDFTYYLAQSEQIPSAVGVSVFVNDDNSIGAAGGYMVQVLPGASDKAINSLESKLKEMPELHELLLKNKSPEDILNLIFGDGKVKFLETMPVLFYCNCSKDKFAKDLKGLPIKELQSVQKEQHGMEVVCNFCQKKYQYSELELQSIIDQAKLDHKNSNKA